MCISPRARDGLKKTTLLALLALGSSGTFGCQPPNAGTVEDGNNGKGGSSGKTGGKGGSGSGTGGAGGSTSIGTGGNGGMGPGVNTPTLPGPNDGQLLPARIRRLTNAEFDASVTALLASAPGISKNFAPDTRQSDFTVNAAQQVNPTLAGQIQSAVRDLSKAAVTKLVNAGCATGDACAQTFIADFVPKAFRRPITDQEKKDLLVVFQTGANGATFADGIALVVEAALQSASFLYVSELGGAAKNGVVTLTPYEIASVLSYLVTGGPPDKALLDAAASGKLAMGTERDAQARRLLGAAGAKGQVQRLVKEWLGMDYIDNTGKDAKVYPKFDGLRPSMEDETDATIAEVVFNDEGTLGKLLSADYTVVDSKLGTFYGLSGVAAGKRTMLTGTTRRGILTQASFLSVHGHDIESAPVLRGATVLRKLMCVALPSPSELNIMVTPPKPDPTLTTRDRFKIHSMDPACSSCHKLIDGFGFAMEGFDGMGGARTTENGKMVDTSAELTGSVAGTVKDAAEMTAKLSENDDVKQCFARNFFRFAAAQSGQDVEDRYLGAVWAKMSEANRTNVKELFAAYAASDVFVSRKVP